MKKLKKRLDEILVERNITQSRTKAQAMIMAGEVYVEDKKITKSGLNFFVNSKIIIKKFEKEWVSRGAIKLLKAINYFKIDLVDKICLDLGASTGGFTQVMLQNKAKKIYSIDVGKNQLNEKLLKEKKIVSIEKTNARYLNDELIKEEIDILVCDVSFISLKKVIKPNLRFLKDRAKIITLVKPQFEGKRKDLNKGVIKNSNVHHRICEDIKNWIKIECNSDLLGMVESPIKGPKGNKEFFIAAEYYK